MSDDRIHKPDATNFDPDPARLRRLLKGRGISWSAAARALGMDRGLLGRKLKGEVTFRYDFQYAIERLCEEKSDG